MLFLPVLSWRPSTREWRAPGVIRKGGGSSRRTPLERVRGQRQAWAHLVPHELRARTEQVLQQAAHQQLEALAVGGGHHVPAGGRGVWGVWVWGVGGNLWNGGKRGRIRAGGSSWVRVGKQEPSRRCRASEQAGPGQGRPAMRGGAAGARWASPLLGRAAVQVVHAVKVHVLCVPARCVGVGVGAGERERVVLVWW